MFFFNNRQSSSGSGKRAAAPLVLGLILGPIAEANFTQGSMIADATDGRFSYFFGGTLNIALILIVIASVAYSAWMEVLQRRQDRADQTKEAKA